MSFMSYVLSIMTAFALISAFASVAGLLCLIIESFTGRQSCNEETSDLLNMETELDAQEIATVYAAVEIQTEYPTLATISAVMFSEMMSADDLAEIERTMRQDECLANTASALDAALSKWTPTPSGKVFLKASDIAPIGKPVFKTFNIKRARNGSTLATATLPNGKRVSSWTPKLTNPLEYMQKTFC